MNPTLGIDINNDIGGLVQDCSNSIANALELLQSCTKPSMYALNVFCVIYQQQSVVWWRINASMNQVIMGLGNDLPPSNDIP